MRDRHQDPAHHNQKGSTHRHSEHTDAVISKSDNRWNPSKDRQQKRPGGKTSGVEPDDHSSSKH